MGDVMGIGAVDWGGASAKRVWRSFLPFQSSIPEQYGKWHEECKLLHVGLFAFGPTSINTPGNATSRVRGIKPRNFVLLVRISIMQSLKSDSFEVQLFSKGAKQR